MKLVNPPLKQLLTTSVCSGKNGVMVSMPGSCSGFFFCVDGNAIASSCGNFYHFNSELGICDHPDNAKCQEFNAIAEVSVDAEANDVCYRAPEAYTFGKARSCTLFYECHLKKAVRRVCPPQKHFNVTAKQCQHIDEARCIYSNPPLEDVTVKPRPAVLPITANGASLRNPMKTKTPEKLHSSTTTFSPASLCSTSGENRTVPHPWDCNKFIFCLSRHAHIMNCPRGLHFSTKTMRCKWPSLAECKLNQ